MTDVSKVKLTFLRTRLGIICFRPSSEQYYSLLRDVSGLKTSKGTHGVA